MSTPEVIDGEPVEQQHPRREVAPAPVPAPAPALAVTPTVEATDLVKRLDVIRDAMNTAMQAGVDYGVIPGTDKPALLKPGAEKLGVLFQLDVQLAQDKTWGPGDHLTVETRATVFHAPTGARLGFGEGLCSTRERKYGKRKAQRVCPGCGVAAVFRSKDDEGGWFCWRKRGGCGLNFAADDERVTSQAEGEVDNPDLPDQWNTVVKMAAKRARVDAVLAVTGASALFTQDLDEDDEPPAPAAPETPLMAAGDVERVASAIRSLTGLTDRDEVMRLWEYVRAGRDLPLLEVAEAILALDKQRAALARQTDDEEIDRA